MTAIVRFFAGYNYCAKRAYPKVKVLNNYAGDPTFNDQTKCRTTALGADRPRLANHLHCRRRLRPRCPGCWSSRRVSTGIGVDADQSFLGPHILTSATKKVNVAVYNAIKEYNADPSGFKTGFNQNYTVKNGGVGYGKLSPKLPKPVAKAYTASTNALAKLIASGKVKVPSGE